VIVFERDFHPNVAASCVLFDAPACTVPGSSLCS